MLARGVLEIADNERRNAFRRSDAARDAAEGKPAPVSYTHLDVYKRQDFMPDALEKFLKTHQADSSSAH